MNRSEPTVSATVKPIWGHTITREVDTEADSQRKSEDDDGRECILRYEHESAYSPSYWAFIDGLFTRLKQAVSFEAR